MTTAQFALKHQSAGAGRKGNAMSSRTLKRFVTPPLASLAIVFLLGASTAVAEVPLGALSTVPVPKPDLTGFVRDEAAAVALGKALFWDMQLGSDGIQSCGACHFHGGADNRLKNQVNPGTLHAATTFEVAKPNATLTAANFPLHKLANPDDRLSAVLFDADDVVSSQSVTLAKFNDIIPGQAEENCTVTPDPIFNVGGVNIRRVQPRNVPTMINAIFTFRNFWDGRGNAIFNGVDGTGPRNPNARVLQVQADGSVVPVAVAIAPASLASQAVPVLGSNFALACTGRTVNKVGKKMLSLTPLAKQWVDPTDSVLGPLARSRTTPGARGLSASYASLIQTAFDPKWWISDKVVTFPGGVRTISPPTGAPLTTSQFTVMEQNFSLFFGLAIQLYETTLVSDASLFDQAQLGLATLTPAQQDGLNTFKGSCAGTQCHSGPTFTAASTNNFGAGSEPIEQRQTAAGANAFHDGGFFNIGVRPTAEDLGVGGSNPAGVPLSFARRDFLGLAIPEIAAIQNPLPPIGAADVLAVDGAFKAPSLRNVELTGPYMHNGGMLTLDQVVEFYTRGGDFHEANAANADAAVDGVGRLVGSPTNRANVVAFLKTLTDDRVRFESAPFDHPQLFIPNGHPGDAVAVTNDGTGKATDTLVEVPASGAAGSCVGVDGTPHFACPVCGDNKVNQASEQCDGTDSVLCPGACRANCTCPPAPRCGDNVVNQASEQCDGTADAACPGRCRADCTCAPAPVCGDNAVNQASEECDGTADSACPGRCRADCTCTPPPVCGDNVVNQANESCDGADDSACPGRCQSDCTCAPPPTCGDNVVNQATESCDGTDDSTCPARCRADCTCAPLPVCGDDVVNQADESCDGADDSACPGRCQADCTCAPLPVCGDNVVNQASESCDGADDSACPGLCRADCTCAPPLTCGDDVVNQATESCDGTDDSTCPGRCRPDCTCTPLPVCGDNVVNQADESCDRSDDSACPGRCQVDCTCAPLLTCGDNVVNQATESCDGTDDSACPGRCRPDCTCAPPPTCGDNVVNQPDEACDGLDDSACPGACEADCTCGAVGGY